MPKRQTDRATKVVANEKVAGLFKRLQCYLMDRSLLSTDLICHVTEPEDLVLTVWTNSNLEFYCHEFSPEPIIVHEQDWASFKDLSLILNSTETGFDVRNDVEFVVNDDSRKIPAAVVGQIHQIALGFVSRMGPSGVAPKHIIDCVEKEIKGFSRRQFGATIMQLWNRQQHAGKPPLTYVDGKVYLRRLAPKPVKPVGRQSGVLQSPFELPEVIRKFMVARVQNMDGLAIAKMIQDLSAELDWQKTEITKAFEILNVILDLEIEISASKK